MLRKLYRKVDGFFRRGARILVGQVSRSQRDLKTGNQLLQQNRWEEAREFFQKYIQKYPQSPHGYEVLCRIDLKNYQRESAAKWLDQSIEKTKAKSSYKWKAGLLINHAQYADGFAVVDELIRVHGNDRAALQFKAEQLFKPRRYSEAVAILQSLEQDFDSQMLLARALIGDQKYDLAHRTIEGLSSLPKPVDERTKQTLQLLACWQKYHLKGANFDQPKIFGIGLSRTATTSLTTALNLLGFTAIHFINPLTNQVIDREDFLYFDAFSDSPVSFRFEELYELFPKARFVYTERNLVDWVRSSSKLYEARGFSTTPEFKIWLNKWDGGKFDKLYHNFDPIYQKSYGSLYADFPDWEAAYQAFEARVNRFFAGKPAGKLLKINICSEPKWDKLCDFLGVPIPDAPFPYSNTVVTKK